MKVQHAHIRQEIVQRYTAGESAGQLARAFEVNTTTIIRVLKREGIQRRSTSESGRLRWTPEERARFSRTVRQRFANQPPKICSVEDCQRRVAAKGWCSKHYSRVLRHADPSIRFPVGPAPGSGAGWRGDAASYRAIHKRLYKLRGVPGGCEHCGMTDPTRQYQWALNWDAMTSSSGLRYDKTGAPYSTDLSAYIPLCASCHQQFDKGTTSREARG